MRKARGSRFISLMVLVGATIKLDIVWTFADIMNGLMAFPNLVGLLGLSNTRTIGGTFLSRPP